MARAIVELAIDSLNAHRNLDWLKDLAKQELERWEYKIVDELDDMKFVSYLDTTLDEPLEGKDKRRMSLLVSRRALTVKVTSGKAGCLSGLPVKSEGCNTETYQSHVAT
ncbi:uncharacterized protein B0T23DRAFT_436345 [Neurospora hispaniola]|uniref:Uncharacterized protein n=1 Tax=Neurospora hispaniola TaxID=588809 RepID=A0AAJ0HZ59_9PEZI|nr:hypothetical protein B0T23DRAFT_436345 [Neurospora hispaniola]